MSETLGLWVARDGPVPCLHLDRPDKRNAMTDSMVARMIESIEAAGQDEVLHGLWEPEASPGTVAVAGC